MALTFTPEAADRLKTLASCSNTYDRAVFESAKRVLRHLDRHPEQHRVGASQFDTTPTTWARVIDVDSGASWLIVWTIGDDGNPRILRIEPAPSFG